MPAGPEVHQRVALTPGDPGVHRGIDIELGTLKVEQLHAIAGKLEVNPAIDQE